MLGILCGTALAWHSSVNGGWRYVLERSYWPKSGLVLYVSTPGAQITLQDEGMNETTLTRTRANGSLYLGELPKGKYRITISAPGRKTAFTQIQTQPDHPLILGFPESIQLPPLTEPLGTGNS
jgi:hypothetical protein